MSTRVRRHEGLDRVPRRIQVKRTLTAWSPRVLVAISIAVLALVILTIVLVVVLTQSWSRHPVLVLVGGACVVTLGCVGGLVSFIQVRTLNDLMTAYATALEDKARALEDATLARDAMTSLRLQIAEVRFDERRRFTRDLHDGIQSHLLGVTINLGRLARRASDSASAEAINQIRTDLRNAIDELDDYRRGLYPIVLDTLGFKEAIQSLVERFTPPITVNITDRRLPPAIELALYFIVSEALTNSIKHANATEVTINISVSDNTVQARISDDGNGGANSQGTGIAGMRQRIEEVGGELSIYSPAGHGTTVRASIPCE